MQASGCKPLYSISKGNTCNSRRVQGHRCTATWGSLDCDRTCCVCNTATESSKFKKPLRPSKTLNSRNPETLTLGHILTLPSFRAFGFQALGCRFRFRRGCGLAESSPAFYEFHQRNLSIAIIQKPGLQVWGIKLSDRGCQSHEEEPHMLRDEGFTGRRKTNLVTELEQFLQLPKT